MINLPKELIQLPSIMTSGWQGYQHFQDPTLLPFNVLTYPSQNCTIPKSDQILPDKGKSLLGQIFTQNTGIIGNKQKFKTLGGFELEVRVFDSLQFIEFNTLVGDFDIGETITGGTSGSTATVVSKSTDQLILSNVSAAFQVGETITGGTSGATAVVTVEHTTYGDTIEILYTDTNPTGAFYNVEHWYQITENVNPLESALHRYSFDGWQDTSLNPALSLNLPRLIWVNGNSKIYSWTGGIAPIVSLVVNTSITTTAGTTWASLGFVDPALGGSGNIVINGVAYAITGGWATDTLTLASTTGITAGDLAFAQIESDSTTLPFDFCKQNKNYMYYGTWTGRDLYQSNNFNHDATQFISGSQAFQNDLIVESSSAYTGTGSHVYRVTIDSVNPPVNFQQFISGGGGNLDDGVYDTSAYAGAAGVENIYNVLMVGNFGVVATAITSGTFIVGEHVYGTVTNAEGIIVYLESLGGGAFFLGFNMVTEVGFDLGTDTLTGKSSGATLAPVDVGSSLSQNFFQLVKNGIVVNTNTGAGSLPVSILTSPGAITLTDGLTIEFARTEGHAVGDSFKLTINQGGNDTFQWAIDGGVPTTGVAITGASQTLSAGIDIRFVSKTGHNLGDYWDIQVDQAIDRAWTEFYYTLPIRKPGEGYKFRLPSNFWTMDTQEEQLYVNSSFGEWGRVITQLSADLQSEDVAYSPLKQNGSIKVIDPWLTGHNEDDLYFVTTDKSLMSLGRQAFLQEPQSGYLSDVVKNDFLASTFTGGSIEYIDKNLYISSPEQGIMHCFDFGEEYWQPPKKFPEVGILSIVGNKLIAHSNTRNQSFTMFNSESGDDGQEYFVEARSAYTSVGDRWKAKNSSVSFIEGYIEGAPKLIQTVYLGVNGCSGIYPHIVKPKVCVAPDRAPLGEGKLGSHSLGSDISIPGNHFNEIFRQYKPIMRYYFVALGIQCTAKNHSWAVLSMGLNGIYSLDGNDEFVNKLEENP